MKHVFGRQGNNGWTYGALMERPRPGERPRGAVRLPSPGAAEGWFPAGFAAGVAELAHWRGETLRISPPAEDGTVRALPSPPLLHTPRCICLGFS